MVGITLKQQLLNFVRCMHEQGILDFNFDNIMAMQSPRFPRFLTELIFMFINDGDVAMAAITGLLSDEVVQFDNLIGYVVQLLGRSKCLGGCPMVQVCDELHQACKERSKERCEEIFVRVKSEYQTLRDNLDHIRQLEESIFAYESRRRRQ